VCQYQYADKEDTGYIKRDILFIYVVDMNGKEQFMEDIRSCPEVIDLGCGSSDLPMSDWSDRLSTAVTY
jgi:hypothetical protein